MSDNDVEETLMDDTSGDDIYQPDEIASRLFFTDAGGENIYIENNTAFDVNYKHHAGLNMFDGRPIINPFRMLRLPDIVDIVFN